MYILSVSPLKSAPRFSIDAINVWGRTATLKVQIYQLGTHASWLPTDRSDNQSQPTSQPASTQRKMYRQKKEKKTFNLIRVDLKWNVTLDSWFVQSTNLSVCMCWFVYGAICTTIAISQHREGHEAASQLMHTFSFVIHWIQNVAING